MRGKNARGVLKNFPREIQCVTGQSYQILYILAGRFSERWLFELRTLWLYRSALDIVLNMALTPRTEPIENYFDIFAEIGRYVRVELLREIYLILFYNLFFIVADTDVVNLSLSEGSMQLWSGAGRKQRRKNSPRSLFVKEEKARTVEPRYGTKLKC